MNILILHAKIKELEQLWQRNPVPLIVSKFEFSDILMKFTYAFAEILSLVLN